MRTSPHPARRPYAARLPASERRRQLLQAALRVVGERGYAGLTMEAVAQAAGVTKPVVYDVFANRDEVMTTLLADGEQRAVAEILEAIGPVPAAGSGVDARALLVEGVTRSLGAVRARPAAYRLILLQTDGTPAVVRQRIEAGRRTIIERVRDVLDQAEGPGGTLDTELMAIAVVALAEHAARLVLTDPVRFPPERFETAMRQVLGTRMSSSL